ncbi:TrmH family RNA methyltransferase [Salegentibacter flavus]|uniref:tRNA (guanosine(18)-2'-O)-methyltransferase n=1 Tax=Salegentibacter flavus TaxID=287099 RepID=A0A1I4YKQ0_9FLAO|nr:RNA methyltransferase [Salegentibacter flavus]SFN38635.1 tRNA (guanosine-2'-O-)-methyltransferase [Salegentibacter flavus]
MEKQHLLEHLKKFLTPRRNNLFEEVLSKRTNFFTVVTQDVHQLHNTSAVIRSCDVFGIQNIHVIEEHQPRRIDKEIAMGAQKWIDVNRYNSTKECIATLRQKGYQIVATTPHGEAWDLEEFEISKPSAVFFGTEKDGLSEEVLKEADVRLKIPMQGFTESLNISVSASIILQSLTSRLRRSELPWQLTPEEKLEIEFNWTKKCIKNSEQLVEDYKASQ